MSVRRLYLLVERTIRTMRLSTGLVLLALQISAVFCASETHKRIQWDKKETLRVSFKTKSIKDGESVVIHLYPKIDKDAHPVLILQKSGKDGKFVLYGVHNREWRTVGTKGWKKLSDKVGAEATIILHIVFLPDDWFFYVYANGYYCDKQWFPDDYKDVTTYSRVSIEDLRDDSFHAMVLRVPGGNYGSEYRGELNLADPGKVMPNSGNESWFVFAGHPAGTKKSYSNGFEIRLLDRFNKDLVFLDFKFFMKNGKQTHVPIVNTMDDNQKWQIEYNLGEVTMNNDIFFEIAIHNREDDIKMYFYPNPGFLEPYVIDCTQLFKARPGSFYSAGEAILFTANGNPNIEEDLANNPKNVFWPGRGRKNGIIENKGPQEATTIKPSN